MSQHRLLRGAPENLDVWFTGPDGGGTVADGDVLVSVTDAAGAAVVSAGTATSAGSGQYTYELPAQSTVKALTALWTGVVSGGTVTLETAAEVVGRHLFTVAEARSWDASALTSTSTYPSASILEERDRITDLLEQWTRRGWVSRYCRVELAGTGGYELHLPDGVPVSSGGDPVGGAGWRTGPWRVLSVTVDGTAVSTSNVKIDRVGRLSRTDATWAKATVETPRNVIVEVEYGETRPVDGIERVALLLLRDRLVKTDIPDSAINLTGEFGNISLVQPGGPYRNVSRIPEVNAWVADHREETYVA